MIKTGPIDSQITEQMKSLGDVIKALSETSEALGKKLEPLLGGAAASSASSTSTEYVTKLCPLAQDLFYHGQKIQNIVTLLRVMTSRLQI